MMGSLSGGIRQLFKHIHEQLSTDLHASLHHWGVKYEKKQSGKHSNFFLSPNYLADTISLLPGLVCYLKHVISSRVMKILSFILMHDNSMGNLRFAEALVYIFSLIELPKFGLYFILTFLMGLYFDLTPFMTHIESCFNGTFFTAFSSHRSLLLLMKSIFFYAFQGHLLESLGCLGAGVNEKVFAP